MGCIISIQNSTDSTPEIIVAQLTGCNWLPGQNLAPPVSIRPWGAKAGWVDGKFPYQIDLTTRFYLYSENVTTRIKVRGNDRVELDSGHSNHIVNNAAWVGEDGEIMVFIEYQTWSRTRERHQLPVARGGDGKVIVRAGTVSSLITKIEQEGGRADHISVNQSTKDYKRLDEALDKLTSTGGPFSSSRYVAVGWKQDIEKKGGTFRDDPRPDNKYHALMDNLEARQVGGVFQQMLNPNYVGVAEEELA